VLAIVLIVGGLLGMAVASATVTYRRLGAHAWSDEYDKEGMGLTIELALLFIVALVWVAISIIMSDSFKTLFLEGGWHSYPYLGAAFGLSFGVAFYMLRVAPPILASKQGVESKHVHRECRRPYLWYTPFSIILWAGLVLPVIAMLVLSFQSDHRKMITARDDLASNGASVVMLADRVPDAAQGRLTIYGLEYRAAVDTVQRTVNRYLWVVAVFIFFLLVILNTRITAAYTEEAQDAFKWMMWVLLAVAVGITLYGVTQYDAMRDLAVTTHERIVATADRRGQLELIVAAKRALLDVREQGAGKIFRGGFVALVVLLISSNGLQWVMAKVTHRSAVNVIFPSRVARFLQRFLLEGEKPPPPHQ
jgi:hypothetical protein